MASKVAIVTGASGNMGQAVVRKFLAEGYIVVGTLVPNDPVQIEITDTQFEPVFVNLMDEGNTQEFVQSVVNKHGSIDVAILTVGGFAMGSVAETKTADVMKQYKLNFETAYNVARPVFVHMMERGRGRLFIIGSKPGLDAKNGKGMIAYGLTKSLIFRLADLMNDEAKGKNVVISVIVPSTIDTPQNRKSMPDVDPAKWVKPEAIADVTYFYCSDAASSIREPVIKVYNNA
jgi:NAD(P)-dependent dehydrogenase (short-subunit alcohol dehydrogenase family)